MVLALTLPNGIQKDGTISEQWRIGPTVGAPFRVDEDRHHRLIRHIFGYIYLKKEASDSKNNGTLL